jgi:predicted component of type VI protein secretion system
MAFRTARMKTTHRFLMIILASLALVGCEATKKDIKQADNYRLGLASHLGISEDQISVTAGSGVTYVTISGVELASERERIAADLRTLNKNNPKLDPLKWTFR